MRFIELSDFFYYTAISYPLVLGKSRFYLPTLSSEASNKKPCRTKHVTEDEIHEKFLEAYNRYIGNRESLICAADKMCGVLSDTNALEQKLEQKTTLRNEKAAIYHEWISFETGERSDSFTKQEKVLLEAYLSVDAEVEALLGKISEIKSRRIKLIDHINSLRERPLILEEWDVGLWVTMIKHCVIRLDAKITFVFRDGKETTV